MHATPRSVIAFFVAATPRFLSKEYRFRQIRLRRILAIRAARTAQYVERRGAHDSSSTVSREPSLRSQLIGQYAVRHDVVVPPRRFQHAHGHSSILYSYRLTKHAVSPRLGLMYEDILAAKKSVVNFLLVFPRLPRQLISAILFMFSACIYAKNGAVSATRAQQRTHQLLVAFHSASS